MDPVTLGLCSQIELDFEVQARGQGKSRPTPPMAAPLCCRPRRPPRRSRSSNIRKQRDDLNVDAVFAKLKTIGGKKADQE